MDLKSEKMWKLIVFLLAVVTALWVSLIYYAKSNLLLVGETSVRFANIFDKIGLSNESSGYLDGGSDRKEGKRKIRHHIPKFMLDLYERSVRNGFDDDFQQPDVVRSVIPKNGGFFDSTFTYKGYQDSHLLIFDVPSTDEDEVFVSAELKILTVVQVDNKALIGLERIIKVSIYDDESKRLFSLEEAHVYHTNNTWLTFNMTAAVSGILSRNENDTFLKIVISVKAFLPYVRGETGAFKLSLLPVEEDFEHDYPVLLLTYSSNRQRSGGDNKKRGSGRSIRSKRNVEDNYEEETNHVWDDEPAKKKTVKRMRHSCRRRPLYVDFAEIRYDLWIVQPSGYEAYQCQGKCFYPVAEHLSPTKHAIVQALLHSVSPSKASRSCCVPTSLESISVLYIDNKGVLTYRYAYKDMVVTDCGCR